MKSRHAGLVPASRKYLDCAGMTLLLRIQSPEQHTTNDLLPGAGFKMGCLSHNA
jgi:hypothetical protein